MSQPKAGIPAWSADGRRLRSYSLSAVLHLEGLSLVSVRRNAHRSPVAMHFRDRDGGSPLRATARGGQKYSFEEPLSDSLRAWKHKDLETGRAEFQRVTLDVSVVDGEA